STKVSALVGVLRWTWSASKLEPRSAADFITGPPALASLDPAETLVDLDGEANFTLTARLTRPAEAALTITLECPPELTCPESVTIDPGSAAAPVEITATAATNGAVVVTATEGDNTATAQVRVYNDMTPRAVLSVTPTPTTLRIGSAETFTITLSLPAGGDGEQVMVSTTGPLMAASTMVGLGAGEREATVSVTAGDAVGMGTVVAMLGDSSATAEVEVVDAPMGLIVFFSEYIEGSSNNKAIEIYNGGGDLPDGSVCEVQLFSNGNSEPGSTTTLPAEPFPSGAVYTICNNSFELDATCDARAGVANYNGNDALRIVCDGMTTDVFGQIGNDGDISGGGVEGAEQTLRRKCSVEMGDLDGSDPFDPSLEWDSFPRDDASDLGTYMCMDE
ncbi:MAG: hypothetical protein AAFX99_30715, partial [Myxococcota bacterium]